MKLRCGMPSNVSLKSSRTTKFDFGKLNSGLVEKIAFGCDVRLAAHDAELCISAVIGRCRAALCCQGEDIVNVEG
jgi:hypothetical protein